MILKKNRKPRIFLHMILVIIGLIASYSFLFHKNFQITELQKQEFAQIENELKEIAPKIIIGEHDSIRIASAFELLKRLENLLEKENSFLYPFDSLKNRTVSIVQSTDKKFRLFTFNAVLTYGKFYNFGILQYKHQGKYQTAALVDTAKKFTKDLVDIELGTESWMGALYYNLIPFKKRGQKMYMLFGYDGSTLHSNKKIIDVLWFDKDGPHFGAPVFRSGPEDVSSEYRMIFEFHNESSMLLKYEPNLKIIAMDILVPSFPEANGNPYYYIPSGDHEYLKQNRDGIWVKGRLDDYKKLSQPELTSQYNDPSDTSRPARSRKLKQKKNQ